MTVPEVHVYAETLSWMKEVKDKSTGETGNLWAQVLGQPNVFAVVVKVGKTCPTKFYCHVHQRFFNVLGACPECIGG